MSSARIAVNDSSSATSSELQDQITLALLANGGVGRIQATLQQRLDEAGWTEQVRSYVTKLFRSGECTTFFEALEKIKSQVAIEGLETSSGGGKKSSTANGTDSRQELSIPKSAADGGVEAVRKELALICEAKK